MWLYDAYISSIWKFCSIHDSINKINNTQVDSAKDIDIIMPVYSLIWYGDNYLKTSGSLLQYCR